MMKSLCITYKDVFYITYKDTQFVRHDKTI